MLFPRYGGYSNDRQRGLGLSFTLFPRYGGYSYKAKIAAYAAELFPYVGGLF